MIKDILKNESKEEIDNNFYLSGYSLGDISEIDDEFTEEKREGGIFAYDGYNFLASFDSDDFEPMFYLTYGIIKDFHINDLRIICRSLIDKIFEKYEYQIIPMPFFKNFEDVDEFLDFVKFLKFDNISFLFDLVTNLSMPIKDIIKVNKLSNHFDDNTLINHSENISFKYKNNQYIFNYLISQSKKQYIEWLNNIYIQQKSDVILELIN